MERLRATSLIMAMDQFSDQRRARVRDLVEASARGDVEVFVAAAHPDFAAEFDTELMPGGADYRGHEGVRRFFAALASVGMSLDVAVEEIRVRGDKVLVIQRTAAERPDGGGFGTRSGAVWTFEGDLIRRITGYLDPAAAERAFEAA
jgi:ketosteroid isomerase-like protein